MYDAEIGKLNGQKKLLEEQTMMIEGNINNKNFIEVMSAGVRAGQVLAKDVNINKFEELKQMHEDLEEGNNEINNFFNDYANEQNEEYEEDLAELEEELKNEEEKKDIEDKPVREGKVKTKYALLNKI